jgi:hypothetical protein
VLGILGQRDQKGQVGVGLHIVGEEWHLPIDEILLQDHMAHGHGERGICASLSCQPFVSELGVVGVVGTDDNDLGAAIPHLGHPVSVGGSGNRDVRAPHHEVGGVPPVA